MIVLFTDFGSRSPYVGQMHMVLHRGAPGLPVADLLHDAPAYNPKAAAYLLGAHINEFRPGDVLLGVVDPGVGGDRRPIVVDCDGVLCVGPDNGLFIGLVVQAKRPVRVWRIDWRPESLSASFHGRDIFAPVAARLARGLKPAGTNIRAVDLVGTDWPDQLAEVIHIDPFGNAMTGLVAGNIPAHAQVSIAGRKLEKAKTFSSISPGNAFWYENANGLLEIAVNQGRAADLLGLAVGDPIAFLDI